MADKIPKHLKNPPPGKNLYEVNGVLRIAKPEVAAKMKDDGVKIVKKAGKAT